MKRTNSIFVISHQKFGEVGCSATGIWIYGRIRGFNSNSGELDSMAVLSV